jgi:hypothetical protein
VEDIAIAFVLAFAGGGGGGIEDSLALAFKAITFIVVSLAASRWLARPIDRVLEWMPREFFLLFTFALLIGMSAISHWLGLSEAIGALMAGVVLSTPPPPRDRGLSQLPRRLRRALLLRLRALHRRGAPRLARLDQPRRRPQRDRQARGRTRRAGWQLPGGKPETRRPRRSSNTASSHVILAQVAATNAAVAASARATSSPSPASTSSRAVSASCS